MAKQSSVNLDITNNADGFDISGGTTARKLTISGADVAIAATGSAVITFPSTTTTIAGLGIIQTFTAAQTFTGGVSAGTISAGTWNGTAIGATYGGTAQTTYALGDMLYSSATNTLAKLSGNITSTKQFLSQTGTSTVSAAPSWSAVSKSDVGLSSVENTAISTWAGSTNITTLGTIATGTWQGTAIADTYISSATTWNTASTDRFKWDGGATGLVAGTGRTSLGLGSVENTAISTWAGSTNITTLGTITTGTWSGTAIGATKGGTGQTTYAVGDLLYSATTNTLTVLAKPAATAFLQMTSAGVPSWETSISTSYLSSSSITVNGTSISLGSSGTVTATATNALTISTGLTGTSYNGSTAVTIAVDTSVIATKSYVDTLSSGLHQHHNSDAATTSKLATLTGVAVSYSSGTQAITWTGGTAANAAGFTDGTTLTANTTEASASHILVKNEGDVGGLGSAYNGTYYLYGARELRRASDGNVAGDWAGGDFIFVLAGTAYNNTGWVQTEKITTLDTDAILFEQFSGAGTYTADESSLTKTGSVFSIKSTYVGQTSITTLGTVATGTWQGTAIADSYISSATTWNTASTDRFKWDGGATGLVAATGRTSLGLDIGTNVQAYNATLAAVAAGTYTGVNTITTLGTISTGTWSATAIGATKGGTGQTTYATGDLIYSSATDVLSKLTKPAATTSFLQMTSAGVPSWQTTIPATAGGTGQTTYAVGDLIYSSASDTLSKLAKPAATSVLSMTSGGVPSWNGITGTGSTVFGTSPSISTLEISTTTAGAAKTAAINMATGVTGVSVTSVITLNGYENATPTTYQGIITSGSSSGYDLKLYGRGVSFIGINTDTMYLGDVDGAGSGGVISLDGGTGSVELNAPTLTIVTSSPVAGKVLTCMDGLGTAEWQTLTFSEPTSSPSISTGTLVLDLSVSRVFTVSLNASVTTLTISNTPATASMTQNFTLILTADGTARTITWPASVKWANNDAPSLTSTNAKKDILSFVSTDAGTTWYGFIGGLNF